MILTSSWDTTVTDIVTHTFEVATLPTAHIAKIYDGENAPYGSRLPNTVNVVRTLGTPRSTLLSQYGVYAELILNNAYDVILLDTIQNVDTAE